MEHHDAQQLAHRLMEEHSLTGRGWTFAFDRATQRLGACHYARRQITLSHTITERSDEQQVTQTLLHEVAHALLPVQRRDGKRIGHGPEWKRLAREIGYVGERTARRAAPISARPRLRRGVQVRSADGQEGVVTKLGRTRGYFRDADGTVWATHFENLTVVVAPVGGQS